MPTSAIDTGFFPTSFTLAATGGVWTVLVGTRLSRMIEIIEDFGANAGVGQGLEYLLPDPTNPPGCSYPAGSGITANPGAWRSPAGSAALSNATTGFKIAPQTEPLKLGDIYAIHQPYGGIVANGPNVLLGVGVTGGTPFIAIRSASADTTVVRVTEFS